MRLIDCGRVIQPFPQCCGSWLPLPWSYRNTLHGFQHRIREQTGSAAERVSTLKTELQSVERKIRNTVDLMVEIGSPSLKQKLFELEESKEKLTFELQQAELAERQMSISENTLCVLFRKAEQELRHGTLANRRKIIDQYVRQVVVYPDRVELVLNFVEGFEWTETIRK